MAMLCNARIFNCFSPWKKADMNVTLAFMMAAVAAPRRTRSISRVTTFGI